MLCKNPASRANHKMMFKLVLATCLIVTATSYGQSEKPRVFKAVRSPEIAADHRATLRIFAPNAKKVELVMFSERKEMTKDDKGVWSFTTAVLEPDIYDYSFLVDGLQLGDPGNPMMKPTVTGGAESLLYIPGPKTLSWEENPVPHGILHRVRFDSKIIGEPRDFIVYTPPGFSTQAKTTYPTLYLLHGVMETETSWTNPGRANVILDNLLAQKKAKPMLIVMPLGYACVNPADGVGDILSGRTNNKKDFETLFQSITQEIQPVVEKNFRASSKRPDRAIAGLSMGGAQALHIGLAHPNVYGDVASFSGGFIMYGSADAWFKDVDLKKPLPRLTVTCGTEDFLIGSNRFVKTWLKGKQIPFTEKETPGAHTWPVWRRNLTDYLPTLFR